MQELIEKIEKKVGIIPYITAGDPNLDITYALVSEFDEMSLDAVELGVPFSDPLADGIVIQKSHQIALKKYINLKDIFLLSERLNKNIKIPLLLMLYYNLVYNWGISQFIKDCKSCGIRGVIIPDLPPEEAASIKNYADKDKIALTFLVTPTTPIERFKLINDYTTGFIYYVSVTGTTGIRDVLPIDIKENVLSLKKYTKKLIYVGFGVSKREHLEYIFTFADGTIIGSAIIKIIHQCNQKDIIKEIKKFLWNLIKPNFDS